MNKPGMGIVIERLPKRRPVCCNAPACTKRTTHASSLCKAHRVSWKPEQKVDGVWYPNGQRFATKAEAKASARACFMAWTMSEDSRAAESPDPVNYYRDETGDHMVPEAKP